MMFIGEAEVQKYLDSQSLMARTNRSDGAAATAISSFSKPIWRNCGAVGYAGGNCRETSRALPGERKDWYD